MCKLNPKHSMYFMLEVFTSHDIPQEEFEQSVREKVLDAEMDLNKDGRQRFHIQEVLPNEQ